MGYEPTVWNTGDVVTSEKLNKLEEGVVGAGPLVLHSVTVEPNAKNTEKTAVKGGGSYIWLDKTWQEIHDAMVSGRLVLWHISETSGEEILEGVMFVTDVSNPEDRYAVSMLTMPGDPAIQFFADEPSGYPSKIA